MEDRLARIELITKRLMRRTRKVASAMITPYPISNAVFGDKIEGPILRYMFPCDGTVTRGVIRLGNKPKKEVELEVKMFNDSISNMRGFVLTRKFLAIEPNIPVTAGDCLEISIVASDEVVTEVWVSFLWKPGVKDIEAKSYLIKELEKLEEETNDNLEA